LKGYDGTGGQRNVLRPWAAIFWSANANPHHHDGRIEFEKRAIMNYLRLLITGSMLFIWSSSADAHSDKWTCITANSGEYMLRTDAVPVESEDTITACSHLIKENRLSKQDLAKAYSSRSSAYDRVGQLDKAIADLVVAEGINGPLYGTSLLPYLYAERGMSYYKGGKYRLAVSDYDKALSQRTEKEWLYTRGLARFKLREYKDAFHDIDRAIAIGEDTPEAHAYRGLVYKELGDLEHAVSDFRYARDWSKSGDWGHTISEQQLAELQDKKASQTQQTETAEGNDQKLYGPYGQFGQPASAGAARVDNSQSASLASANPSDANPSPQVHKANAAPSVPVSAAVTPLTADHGKRIALVIGNSLYRNVPRLDNPVNDAKLIADALKSLGFKLVGDGAQLDLDKAGIDSAVQSFGNELQGADVGLFYYAGHGVQVRGHNYLVPVSANPTKEAESSHQ
jgi:tetratricopeptide (TPR) repeat protein